MPNTAETIDFHRNARKKLQNFLTMRAAKSIADNAISEQLRRHARFHQNFPNWDRLLAPSRSAADACAPNPRTRNRE